jgi:hypothetical protein
LDFLDGDLVRVGGLPDASWYNAAGGPVDWSEDSRSLTYLLAACPQSDPLEPPNRHVLIMLHAGDQPQQFIVPPAAASLPWRQFVNTAAETPLDAYPEADGPAPPSDAAIELQARSLACYVARDEL